MAGGYTSVMIDGSSLPYEDNVELTREVVKYCHPLGVTVEGELGVLAGVEDHVFSETSTYTNPMQAVDFFKKTKVDALAISYGTCHGPNKGKDTKIRREIAIATKECMLHEQIDGFLVSHGSSTVPQEFVAQINSMGGESTRSMWTQTSEWQVPEMFSVCFWIIRSCRAPKRSVRSIGISRQSLRMSIREIMWVPSWTPLSMERLRTLTRKW